MNKILELDDVHAFYGEAHVLHGVSLVVQPGQVVCLIGRNGMGKSTTLKAIMGLVHVRKGGIYYRGEAITNWEPYKVFKKAIGYIPEDRRIFASLTVRENLLLGAYYAPKKKKRWTIEEVFKLFPVLKEKQDRSGAMLSGGEQQMLAIARSLMSDPELLLIDEPCEGLAPIIVQELGAAIKRLYEEGLPILLVEQSLKLSKELGDYYYVLSKGQVVFSGDRQALFGDGDVISKYLGVNV